MGSKYLVFWNSSFLLINGYSIFRLCLTFWTNEFLGSYSNYKFIISFSIFNRIYMWRILCLQSNIEEVLSLGNIVINKKQQNIEPLIVRNQERLSTFISFIFSLYLTAAGSTLS